MAADIRRLEAWRALVRLAKPHSRHFVVVACLAPLATGSVLVGPLIYRVAVNDIAGLSVGTPGTQRLDLIELKMQAIELDPDSAGETARSTTDPAVEEH